MISLRSRPQRSLILAGRPGVLSFLVGIWASFPLNLHAQNHHPHAADDVGAVSFRVSCSDAAQPDFDRALAMLHHMMYPESRAIFEAIATREPACAMAHWGIAMTRFQPLWNRPSQDDVRAGWAALQRARETGLRTDRERALVAGTEAFFRDPDADEWFPRLARWADAMAEAHRAHPDDADIAALYALARIAAGQVPGSDRLAYNAAAARVLLGVHERQPSHPGALHYTIHANDMTGRESESLALVRGYDKIAPSVPHALHMPTHIFVRLGEWPEVIEWNRKSADAALNFPAGDRTSMHHVHALDYLLYAYLQSGEDEKARMVLAEAAAVERYDEQFASAFHLAVMPARYAIERRAWTEAAALTPRAPAYVTWDRFAWPEALTWFARGMGAAHTGDQATAAAAESRMRQLADQARRAGTLDHVTYIEVDRLVLAGTLAKAKGQTDSAVALLRAAADLEKTVQKHPVTPGSLLPAYEALGDLLAELNRSADALAAYEASLATWPARYNSLLGAARAASTVGAEPKAREYYVRLLEIAGDGDAQRAGVAEAKSFLRTGS